MKTTIGGDRLGSGSKQEVSLRNYGRSTHDLSYIWRSSMSAGTLVPFMNELALPGDSFDIDLNCDVKTLPTVGPLFGSFKVQLDVFEVPIRLFQGKLHMNMLNIGMDMSEIKLPQFEMVGKYDRDNTKADAQVNPSSIYSYLNVNGLGRSATAGAPNITRQFNAIPLLGYWSIVKQYYANLQEENAYVIHDAARYNKYDLISGVLEDDTGYVGGGQGGNYVNFQASFTPSTTQELTSTLVVEWNNSNVPEEGSPKLEDIRVETSLGGGQTYAITDLWENVTLSQTTAQASAGQWQINCDNLITATVPFAVQMEITETVIDNVNPVGENKPQLTEFKLTNIDDMRETILQNVASPNAVIVDYTTVAPYGLGLDTVDGAATGDYEQAYARSNQEGLAVKTYQSDLNNNFIDSDWISNSQGTGVADVSAVLVSTNVAGDDVVKMDALNLSQKVYNMLNRIAVSGGSYDDWLDAVYTHDRAKSVESPVYHGSLIKNLAFEEVISTANTDVGNVEQPLGELGGRGRLTGKDKGGKIKIKCHEPSVILGIISLTPQELDYSQGNKWNMNLKTMNDFHKPELSSIGFEDKITDTLAWFDTVVDAGSNPPMQVTTQSMGKQPAWINYMSNVNETHGNFAMESEMFMTLNRRYEQGKTGIEDLTTYIDPSKMNHIFAQPSLSAMNYWCQISVGNKARRKMSAKLIPNL